MNNNSTAALASSDQSPPGLHLLSAGFSGFGHAPETSDGSERSSSPPSPSPPQHSSPPLIRVPSTSHNHLLQPSDLHTTNTTGAMHSLQQKLNEVTAKQQQQQQQQQPSYLQQHGTGGGRGGAHGRAALATPPGVLAVHQLGARYGALVPGPNSNNFSIRALLGLNTEAFTCHVCRRQFR